MMGKWINKVPHLRFVLEWDNYCVITKYDWTCEVYCTCPI